ncbi:MAG TPA: PDZ domain-containing protein [Steroidobacteraceae bacterium]|jgi:hypothetical protein
MKTGVHSSLVAKPTAFSTAALCLMLLATPGMQVVAAEAQPDASRTEMQRKLEAAQKRLDSAAREVADLSMSMSDEIAPRIEAFMGTMGRPRAVLGLNMGSARDGDRADGVEVASVSPGGAAEAAGIKAGDVLTEVAGKSLQRDGEDAPRDKLLAAMREVKPEQKVKVKYLRAGKVASAEVIAHPLEDRFFRFPGPLPGGPGGLPGYPKFAFGRAEGVFGSAELVPLTAKLGQYFGVDKGLLVVRAPEDSRLQLEDGDVILDVDGRVPSSPSHALRILGSYQAGEKLKLNVLRMKKRLSFDITIPEGIRGDGEGPFERSNFTPSQRIETTGPAPFVMPLPPTSAVPVVVPLYDRPV